MPPGFIALTGTDGLLRGWDAAATPPDGTQRARPHPSPAR